MSLSVLPEFERRPVRRVPVDCLRYSYTPRLQGVHEAHVHALAEASTPLPPVIVHRSTNRVIDGMHRVRAAILCGLTEIDAWFFDGDEREAFALSVRANISHGLPLSRVERNTAATRVIALFPDWSDRAVASCVGLSDKTVAAIRRRSGEPVRASAVRRGMDGRERPVDIVGRRLLASELIKENPASSLREIAQQAGIAPSTVMDVRNRMMSGQSPLLDRHRDTEEVCRPVDHFDVLEAGLRVARLDPALRFNESGRQLLRWLGASPVGSRELTHIVSAVPSHCVDLVADLARRNAELLQEFVRQVQRREQSAEQDRSNA